jgi:hypothetical protein
MRKVGTGVQTPVRHSWPAEHVVGQLPQCSSLVITSAHSAPHIVKPLAQVQTLAVHAPPGPQSVSQSAQWLTDEVRSKQVVVPHATSGARQPHTPAVHVCPAPHAWPHAPQWSVLVIVS